MNKDFTQTEKLKLYQKDAFYVYANENTIISME